jgi:Phosphate-selective porin O and P
MFKSTSLLSSSFLLLAFSAAAQDVAPAAPLEAAQPEPTAPTPPPAEPDATAPLPAEPYVPAPDPEESKLLERLGIGKKSGFWQPAGILQWWLFSSHESDSTATEFRLRRAEIRVRGEIIPKLVGYTIMIDPARAITADSDATPLASLQDFGITVMSPFADVTFGQFKIPISLEAITGGQRLLFPERPLVTRAFSDTRDTGLKLEKKFGDVFYYYAGVFNGAGQNLRENDKEKDLTLRLEAYPVAGLTVAAAGYVRVGDRDRAVKDRIEGDLRYDADGLLVQAEYIRAWDGPDGERVEGHGGYVAGGYLFAERFQPALRVGFLDADVDAPGNVMHYEGCVNYLLQGYEVKFALALGHFVPDAGPSETQITLLSQVWF